MGVRSLLRPARRSASAARLSAVVAVAALGLWASDALGLSWLATAHYQAHVSTDKPIYRVGEPVFFRTVVLDAYDHTPFPATTQAQVTVKGPGGGTVWRGVAYVQDAVSGAVWSIPVAATFTSEENME